MFVRVLPEYFDSVHSIRALGLTAESVSRHSPSSGAPFVARVTRSDGSEPTSGEARRVRCLVGRDGIAARNRRADDGTEQLRAYADASGASDREISIVEAQEICSIDPSLVYLADLRVDDCGDWVAQNS